MRNPSKTTKRAHCAAMRTQCAIKTTNRLDTMQPNNDTNSELAKSSFGISLPH